jgi:hypothetical protein
MADGPGKYDDLATHVREQTQAAGILLVVLGGNRGHGFEFQYEVANTDEDRFRMMSMQIKLLRDVADQIEAQMQKHVVVVTPT